MPWLHLILEYKYDISTKKEIPEGIEQTMKHYLTRLHSGQEM